MTMRLCLAALCLLLPILGFSQDTLKIIPHSRALSGFPSDSAVAMLSDKGGHVWAYFSHRGVGYFDNKTWTYFDTTNGLWSNTIRPDRSFVDSLGYVWINYENGDWAEFDGYTWSNHRSPAEATGPLFRHLHSDKNGDNWFGCASHVTGCRGIGFVRDGSWTYFTTKNGLASDSVLPYFDPKNRRVWVVYWRRGVGFFEGGKWNNFSTRNGLKFDTTSENLQFNAKGQTVILYPHLFMQDGRIRGASLFDGAAWRHLPMVGNGTQPGLGLDSAGDFWLSTDGFMARVHDTTVIRHVDSGASSQLTAVYFPAPDGKVWIRPGFSTFQGFTFWDGVQRTRFDEQAYYLWNGAQLLPHRAADVRLDGITYDSRGLAWALGTNFVLSQYGYTTYHFDGTAWRYFRGSDGLAQDIITQKAHDRKGNTYALYGSFADRFSNRGVGVYDGMAWSNFTTGNGLMSNWVTAIRVDARDRLWVHYGTTGEGVGIRYKDRWTNVPFVKNDKATSFPGLRDLTKGEIWGSAEVGKGLLQITTDSLLSVPVTKGPPRPVGLVKGPDRAKAKTARRSWRKDMRWILGRAVPPEKK